MFRIFITILLLSPLLLSTSVFTEAPQLPLNEPFDFPQEVFEPIKYDTGNNEKEEEQNPYFQPIAGNDLNGENDNLLSGVGTNSTGVNKKILGVGGVMLIGTFLIIALSSQREQELYKI